MINENDISKEYVYVSTYEGDIYKLDINFNVYRHVRVGQDVTHITSNHLDNLYVVNNKIRKFNHNSEELWTYDEYASDITCIQIDNDDCLYSSHRDGSILKIDPDGSVIRKFLITDSPLLVIDVDPTFTIHAAGWNGNVYQITPDGKVECRVRRLVTVINDLKVDLAGNVHVICSDCSISKYNKKQELLWEYAGYNQTSKHISVAVNGKIYYVNLFNKLCHLDSTGHLIWEMQLDKEFDTISVDINNNIFIGSDNEIRRINYENKTTLSKILNGSITDIVAINKQ